MMVHPRRTIYFIDIIMQSDQKNPGATIRKITKAHK